jgi:hypothetical protein
MRFPRMMTRRLLALLVTVVAIVLGTFIGASRASAHQRQARDHRAWAIELRRCAAEGRELPGCVGHSPGAPPPTPERLAQMRSFAVFNAILLDQHVSVRWPC